MLEVLVGLVALTGARLKGKLTVTVPELAQAMLLALEDMKGLLRVQGLKVDPDPEPERRAAPRKRRGKAR
jgi:hypothetical protein